MFSGSVGGFRKSIWELTATRLRTQNSNAQHSNYCRRRRVNLCFCWLLLHDVSIKAWCFVFIYFHSIMCILIHTNCLLFMVFEWRFIWLRICIGDSRCSIAQSGHSIRCVWCASNMRNQSKVFVEYWLMHNDPVPGCSMARAHSDVCAIVCPPRPTQTSQC